MRYNERSKLPDSVHQDDQAQAAYAVHLKLQRRVIAQIQVT